MKRIILETGMGSDLYGQDMTKAAIRAVNDAIRHSSISMFSTLGLDHAAMEVRVTIGVPEPDRLDCDRVAAELPRGKARVTAVKGGQSVPDGQGGHSTIATAAVEAFVDIEASDWRLSNSNAQP